MIQKVIKRDGKLAKFDVNNIVSAIMKAQSEVGQSDFEVAIRIGLKIQNQKPDQLSIDDIQKIIEKDLMKVQPEVAREYISYRAKRDKARESKSPLAKSIISVVTQKDVLLSNENANKDSKVFPVQRDLLAGVISKHFARNNLLPPHILEAHDSGDIHYHDLDYSPFLPMTNCFSGDTKVITCEGTYTLEQLQEMGREFLVPTHTGSYKKAVAKAYGWKYLNTVTLRRGRLTKTLQVTGNHRWILKDGSETTNLKLGDKLFKTPTTVGEWESFSDVQKKLWCLGFGYADGSMKDNGSGKSYFVLTLCGKKVKYRNRFEEVGFSVTDTKHGVIVHLNGFEKELPSDFASIKLAKAYLTGMFDADGGKQFRHKVGKEVVTSIQMTGREINEFLDQWMEACGFYQGAVINHTGSKTNFGERKGLTFERKINSHQEHMAWEVVYIQPNTSHDVVYCLEVEDDHSFLLSNGVVTGNCCLVDLKTLLGDGFRLGNAQIESPKSIGVACAVMAQITAQVASHQYGGTTFANIDQVLEPYVQASWNKHHQHGVNWGVRDSIEYADSMTKKEVYDGIQAYEYEINTLFTTNGQTPFVTVTFGMGTGKYARWIQEAILKVRIKGLGKDGITAVFPKLVMFLEEGINLKKEDPNYDIKQLALECSSKRLYPDIISAKINREITGSPTPVSPMGCRSFLAGWKDAEGNYTLDGRNNLGVVSVNLPRIAIESGGNFGTFWGLFSERLALAKEALETRIDSLHGVKASVAPILYTEGAFGTKLQPDDEVIELFKHGRASISVGYIGIHEVMQIMYPEVEHPLDSPDAQQFGKMVVEQMKATVMRWKEESDEGWGFSLYSTPSESLCDRFCRLDKEKFGEIKGITDKGWYMNSFHFDVDKKVTPFEKIDFEKDYHFIATGGHISYAEFPDLRNNLQALESVWDYAMERLAYFGTNTPSDLCFECKFEGEFKATSKGFECPKCGNHDSNQMSVIRRVCGYLGAPNSRGFNPGKQQEVCHRIKHIET